MNKNFSILVYLFASLLIIAFAAKSLDYLADRSQQQQKANPIIIDIYQDANRNLKYANGACSKDSECSLAGCSSELCTSQTGIVSACIAIKDHPQDLGYTCGCYKNKCSWLKSK